jgi:transposase InsO family protein
LQKQIEGEKDLNIKFEFTAPYTPEMNGKIERKFATLYGKTRSMFNGARLTKELRNGLWAQCAKLFVSVSRIKGIISTPSNFPEPLKIGW